MRCLDIIRVVVSPGPSHSSGIFMVWDNVVVVGELFVADRAFLVLIDDLPVQQFPHLRRRPELPISSRVMRIFDPLHAKPHCPGFGDEFATAAGNRFVYGTEFIASESHKIPPEWSSEME